MTTTWTVRVTRAAEDDFQHILRWTVANFGRRQGKIYAKTLSLAISALSRGPDIPGARRRHEISSAVYSLHVARAGRKGRHFVLFRVSSNAAAPTIEVLRILHETMDIERHLS